LVALLLVWGVAWLTLTQPVWVVVTVGIVGLMLFVGTLIEFNGGW